MPKSKDVDAWFARYDNPMKDVVQRIREIVLGADPRIEECIKWQAPTFAFRGNLANAAQRDLERLVKAWCEWREAAAGGARAKPAPAARKPAARTPARAGASKAKGASRGKRPSRASPGR
jgi:hypothetical protein